VNAIFHHLNTSQIPRNVAILRQLDVFVKPEEMARINRAFGHNVGAFMDFTRKHPHRNTTQAMDDIHAILMNSFTSRIGSPDDQGETLINSKNITKLWSLLCGDVQFIRFEEMNAIVFDILQHALTDRQEDGDKTAAAAKSTAKEALPAAAAAPDATPEELGSGPGKDTVLSSTMLGTLEGEGGEGDDSEISISSARFYSIPLQILSRFAVDDIVQSAWNKRVSMGTGVAQDKSSQHHHVSYSAFEAYMRHTHIDLLEAKLKYLLQLELSIAGPSVYALVHVYISDTQDEAVVLVHEPLGGEVLHVVLNEDLTFLPSRQALEEALQKKLGVAWDVHRFTETCGYNEPATYLFNPHDTPVEDAAIGSIVSRLRIVRGSTQSQNNRAVLAEDPRFVQQLVALLEAASGLPFFSTCNDTSLYVCARAMVLQFVRNKIADINSGSSCLSSPVPHCVDQFTGTSRRPKR
jgi:hypothetical protein